MPGREPEEIMKSKLSFHLVVIISMLLAALPAQAAQARPAAPAVPAAPAPEGVKPPLPEQIDSVLVESISAGGFHTCEVKSDGTLACWGYNSYGQSSPPDGTFTQVSAGNEYTCGLKSDGTLACWGNDGYGQSSPPDGTFTQVSAGFYHTCGLKSDGTLACWGDNTYGQSTPPSGTFTQVSAGLSHTCGLKSDGTLACWGSNSYGESTPPGGIFTQVSAGQLNTCGVESDGTLACWGANYYGKSTPPAGTFTQVSAGGYHSCGLKSDGTIVCWGAGTTNTGVSCEYGQSIPPTGTFTQVSAGAEHTCGLKSDGSLSCWGNNTYGQSNPFSISGNVGVAGATLSYNDGPDKTATSAPDGSYSFAVSYNWSGTVTPSKPGFTFSPLNLLYSNILADQTGQDYTATAITYTISGNAGVAGATLSYTDGSDKTVTSAPDGSYSFTVSYNWSGTVTPSNPGYIFSPLNLPYSNVLADETGQNYTVTAGYIISGNTGVAGVTFSYTDGILKTAMSASDSSYTFTVSHNWSGTVTPSKPGYTFSPINRPYTDVLVDQTSQDYTATWVGIISAGGYHTCWLKIDGTLACWGAGTTNTGTWPDFGQSIPPAGTFTQVSAGGYNSCGLKSNGTLACWGDNSAGQSTPPAGTFTQVSAGNGHTCGLKSDGTLACWGRNVDGESTPPGGTFTQVSAGYNHTCGLKSNGTLVCWGDNYYYQSNLPAGTFTQVSEGETHTCGLKSDGTLACWGDIPAGESTPPAGTFTQVSAGGYHSCGLKSDGTLACWGAGATTGSPFNFGQATPPAGTFTQVSAGGEHTCGLKSDGTLACWGSNSYGQSAPFSISGSVGVAGATLSYTDGSDKTATSASNGSYSLNVSYDWSGTVTPDLMGYAFSPVNRLYTEVLADHTGQNYTATAITYTISGNAGVAGATLSYTDVSDKTATSAPDGSYSFTVSYNWSGTITPSKAGYTFSPVNRPYTDVLADQTGQDYTATAGYTISGNTGVAGAHLSYIDDTPKTATADGNGNYSFAVSYNWSGTVTPSKPGYTFSPVNRPYTDVLADQTDQNYTVTAITYTISGNAGVAGAYLINDIPEMTIAAADGSYSFTVPYDWSGTITPDLMGYTFSPVNRTYTDVLADQTDQNYTATAITYTISGNAGVGGATLSYTGGGPVTASSGGVYTIHVTYGWSGTVTPSKAGYTFSPVNRPYTDVLADQTGQDYTATAITYTISGSTGPGGVTLSYTDGTAKTVTSASNGSYTITIHYGWSGTVTPSKTGYTFSPANRTYTNVITNKTGQNYTALVAITGNADVGGVTLTYTDGTVKHVTSASNGNYSISVPSGWSGTVTPSKTGVTFTPASRSYTNVTSNMLSQDYAAKVTATFNSTGAYDGWILESAKGSGVGGTKDATATTFQLGDDASNRQYRAILSFDTRPLPDTAIIQSAVLKIDQSGSTVGSISSLGSLYASIRKGYFSTSYFLQLADFNAPNTASKVAAFGTTPVSGWYSATLISSGRSNINTTGLTQFRLFFNTATNANSVADYRKFVSGDGTNKPQLIITYTLP
jgi:alpha-tubulin suppressor-like RCC1 family protein